MKLAKRQKKVIKMMSCRKSKLYILSFLIFIIVINFITYVRLEFLEKGPSLISKSSKTLRLEADVILKSVL